jgi:hypothetical protein
MVTGTDGERKCGRLSTPAFVTAVYGDVATCAAKERGDDPATHSTSATVESVHVEADTATATVTAHGGAFDGTTGRWTFTRAAGAWQVSEWGTDYVRSAMSALFGPNYHADADDPLRETAARQCVSSTIQARDDQALRALVFATMQGRTDPLQQIITGCTTDAAVRTTGTDTSRPEPRSAPTGSAKTALQTAYTAFGAAAGRAEQHIHTDLVEKDRDRLLGDIDELRNAVRAFDRSVRAAPVPDPAGADLQRLLAADEATIADLDAMSASTDKDQMAAAVTRVQADAPTIDSTYDALIDSVDDPTT